MLPVFRQELSAVTSQCTWEIDACVVEAPLHLSLSLIEDDIHGLQLHHAGVHPQGKLLAEWVLYLCFWYIMPCKQSRVMALLQLT